MSATKDGIFFDIPRNAPINVISPTTCVPSLLLVFLLISRLRGERPKLADEPTHYETGSSCTESDEEPAKREQKEVAGKVEERPFVSIEAIREQNRADFPERTDVANERDAKPAGAADERAFFRLLARIKGERVAVQRPEDVDRQRAQLPLFAEEQGIVETIDENTVTIISGETGSGKTTQVPQFLYEAGYTSRDHLIGVTEPRRVAAMSMSERIRFEGNRMEWTRVLFMTDGVLLKELQTDVKLSRFSVIVIDEAHERSMYSDVLIGLFSRICVQRAKAGVPLKLVIMSATLRLSDFMQQRLFPTTLPKLLSVESRQFPVTVHFERRTPDDHMRAAFLKVCKIHERLPEGGILVFVSGQKEVHRLVRLLGQKYAAKDNPKRGKKDEQEEEEAEEEIVSFPLCSITSISIAGSRRVGAGRTAARFGRPGRRRLRGRGEDEAADEFELRDERPAGGQQRPLFCLPLYSMLPSALQRRVFEPVPAGCRLCVVATNVAETSLTIPGVRYVVDAGKEKRRDFDPVAGVSQFNVAWISKASAAQRSGRAGRVAAGHAYRLYSSAVFEDFAAFPPPEILHKPVDQVVLHLKSMGIRKIANFPFPTPPAADQVQNAEERLVRLGALSKKKDDDAAGITPLGRTLLVFPLAPHFAKIIVLGAENGVLPPVATLVAALSVREPLVNVAALEGATDAETQGLMAMLLKQRRRWTRAGQQKRLGDLQVLLAAVREADEKRAADRAAATTCGLRFEALREIRKMRGQLLRLVDATGGLKRLAEQNGSSTTADLANARQIFAACQPDQIARRAPVGELVPKGAYRTPLLEEFVFIDPVSALYKEAPEFVLYQDLVQLADRKLLQNVAEVELEWLRSGLVAPPAQWTLR
ncbi:hypothetical protein M3Y99_01763100 [Aphelenchoides fujianensis]|nr:hypothetical protein M3Y99_01763100 [Aphelenchoides fujianensis]